MSDNEQKQPLPEIVIERFETPRTSKVNMSMVDESQNPTLEVLTKSSVFNTGDPNAELQSAIKTMTGSAEKKAPRLAFTENPAGRDNYLGLYKAKKQLVPDDVIKTVRITDHLIATILRTRGGMLSLYGHLRKNRFDIGVELLIKPEFYNILSPEQFEKIKERMKKLEHILLNCGHTKGLENHDRMTLAQWMEIQTHNGLSFGRFATEIIYDRSGEADEEGKFPFSRFRPVDVATINPAVRKGENVGNNVREIAYRALQSMKGEIPAIDVNKLKEDKYAWIQMIEGLPRQAFTHDEMLVFNLFPSTDIEHNGYPVSPIDTIVNSITTHISIDAFQKLYFQNGRASKGLLVIQSDEVDAAALDSIKLQFNASINSVSNSFRTPIFGVPKDDDVKWVPLAGEGSNATEFSFMSDQVARIIMAAFSVSPDELPGYGHLSKGTNSQTLSESNNEFKLTAARDSGLRPLILKFQTFFNQNLLPLIDPLLSKICEIKFSGIDAASKEQESTRLQQDSALHMTYDDLLNEVDKDPIGAAAGGNFPFNERFQLIADKYLSAADLRAKFFADPASMVDPMLAYKRDPFWLQYVVGVLLPTNSPALKAFLAPKPHALDFLKLEISDMLEESSENE